MNRMNWLNKLNLVHIIEWVFCEKWIQTRMNSNRNEFEQKWIRNELKLKWIETKMKVMKSQWMNKMSYIYKIIDSYVKNVKLTW